MEWNYTKADRRTTRKEFLPLYVKVAAISLYDKHPEYRTVARHFPCSVNYIKQVIDSRDEILEEWNRLRKIRINEQKSVSVGQLSSAQHCKITQWEMKILNYEVDVWIRECINDPNFVASDALLEAKAIELMRFYHLKNIVPDASWISSIRKKYHLKNGEDPPSDAAEADTSSSEEDNNLAAEDQVRESKDDQNTIQLNCDTLNRPSSRCSKKRPMLKLELLNETMYEWILRMQAKGFAYRLTPDFIVQFVKEANKHVKVLDLNPQWWFNKFRLKYCLAPKNLKLRRQYMFCGELKGHLSLEIPDIIDFVKRKKKRKENKHQTVSASQRYQSKCGYVVEDVDRYDEGGNSPETSQELGDMIDGEEFDIIADDVVLVKCKKVVDNDVPVKVPEVVDDVDRKPDPAKRCIKTYSRSKFRKIVPGIVPIEGPSTSQKTMAEVIDISDDDDPVTCEEVVDDVPVKFEKVVEGIETVDCDVVGVKKEDTQDEEEYVTRKEKRLETHNPRGTEKFIKSKEEALQYLKALENFVLLQANFRAIGVISQLEAVFRNPDLNH